MHTRYSLFPLALPRPKDKAETLLTMARDWYIVAIQELQQDFLSHGTNLWGATNADHLVLRVRKRYFGRLSDEERNKEHHWPRIFWFQKLQGIFEDEEISLEQALINGWGWFMEPGQYPSKHLRMSGYVKLWHEIGSEKQTRFLKYLSINGKSLKHWSAEIQSMSLTHRDLMAIESEGLKEEFRAAGRKLDVCHPNVTNPTQLVPSECPVCLEQLLKEEVGSAAEHRPVETSCRHVFGYKCLQKWFEKHWSCPHCRKDLLHQPRYMAKPEELLQSCDRILKWLERPCPLLRLPEPHSYLDQLALVFESANDIREHMSEWFEVARSAYEERAKLDDLGLYMAR